jgi:hypothetical protein
MSFNKNVDNIINDLKDINKMYFSLQTKNKILSMKLKEKKYKRGAGERGAGERGAGERGADESGAGERGAGNNLSRPIGYGTSGNIDTSDFPAAGISGSNRNSSHNQWTTSLRRWWM